MVGSQSATHPHLPAPPPPRRGMLSYTIYIYKPGRIRLKTEQHFIGNKAIFIDKGEDELHILYSTRTTVLSLFLPILVLLLAFLAVTTNDRVQWWRIGLSGLLSGSAICGMHYLGNASIENYRCEYAVANIVGAAVIAVAACTIALSLFFVMQAAWTISWWRKIACAMLLAGAVSGMHWCAAVGTKYRLLHLSTGLAGISRETTIIVVICLVSYPPSPSYPQAERC